MKQRKCPICELNYIEDNVDACLVCRPAQQPIYRKSKSSSYSPKKPEEGNVAFKCNYCGGSKDDTQIGYAGVCSKNNIRRNIEIEKHKWCCYSECECFLFLDGKLPYEKLKDNNALCYESHILVDWKMSAGENISEGERKGTKRKLSKSINGGLCILTTNMPEEKNEEKRLIFGVFISDKFEEGKENLSGFVQCTSKYKIKLSADEAKKILFWNYYKNKVNSENPRWGSGLFRYIDDCISAQILRDILSIKMGTLDEVLANEILDYYCKIKGLDREAIPRRSGALAKI